MFERSACFYVTVSRNFERFQYFNFEINFLKNKKLLQKMEYSFLVETQKFNTQYFHAKVPYKKPMLRQIVWRVQKGYIIKN